MKLNEYLRKAQRDYVAVAGLISIPAMIIGSSALNNIAILNLIGTTVPASFGWRDIAMPILLIFAALSFAFRGRVKSCL